MADDRRTGGRRELWDEAGADLYHVLDVPVDASATAVQEAWRAAAKHTHPDRGGDEAAFRAVHIAYLVLSDPEQRARYDDSRREALRPRVVIPPPPQERWPEPPAPMVTNRSVVWLAIVAGIAAVALSYAWPVFTVITGVVVGVVVTVGYLRLAHLRSRWH